MRRLYRQFYLTIVASLVLVVLFGGALWRFAPGQPRTEEPFQMAGEMVATLLPPADQSVAVQQEAIDRLHERSRIDLALFDRNLRRIAEAGRPLPMPRREKAGWLYGRGGPAWAIRLPDERWIVARVPGRRGPPVFAIVAFLGSIALAVAICAYPWCAV